MSKLLFANPDLCTGCNRCTTVCSAVKTGSFAPSAARLRINNYAHQGFSAPSICFQCPKAHCMDACPAGAFSRNEDGVVVIDKELCQSCGACVEACPYGMVEMDAAIIPYKCDYCGGDPACVKECAPGALTFEEARKDLLKIKAKQMKQRTLEGLPSEKRDNLGRALLVEARGESG